MSGGMKQHAPRLDRRSWSAVAGAITTSKPQYKSAKTRRDTTVSRSSGRATNPKYALTSLGGLDHGNERQSEHSSMHL